MTWKQVCFPYLSAPNLDWLFVQLHTLLNHSITVVFGLNALPSLTAVFTSVRKGLYFIYASYLKWGVYFVGFMDIVFHKDWSCVRAVSWLKVFCFLTLRRIIKFLFSIIWMVCTMFQQPKSPCYAQPCFACATINDLVKQLQTIQW